jgi:PAS domain S-box-containing protein
MSAILFRRRIKDMLKGLKQYQALVESIQQGMCIVDSNERIIFANPCMCSILGYCQDELIGMSLFEVVSEEEFQKILRETVKRKNSISNKYELVMKRKDSELRNVTVSAVPWIHSEDEFAGTLTMLIDVTEQKSAKEAIRRNNIKLHVAVEAIGNTLASVVEKRDPFTTGHQHRVSALGVRVAKDMDLPDDQIQGLQLASLIHDVGKIYVPAEILNIQKALTESEFALVRYHVLIGYEILKTIEFPWPVAEIVLQHHERLDGSGYPKGIKADEILLEAKILGAADVVEAMISKRPYRLALSMDEALDEISINRGVLYDPRVVDVCLQVFRDKSFKFE